MRVIEADDVFAALAAFALDADEFFGIDAVPIMRRIGASIAAAGDGQDGLCAIIVELAEKHATALVGISFFSMLAQREVGGLWKF